MLGLFVAFGIYCAMKREKEVKNCFFLGCVCVKFVPWRGIFFYCSNFHSCRECTVRSRKKNWQCNVGRNKNIENGKGFFFFCVRAICVKCWEMSRNYVRCWQVTIKGLKHDETRYVGWTIIFVRIFLILSVSVKYKQTINVFFSLYFQVMTVNFIFARLVCTVTKNLNRKLGWLR